MTDRRSNITAPPSSTSAYDGVNQELPRNNLKTTLTNAIDHARMANRSVGVLIVVLTRGDRRDAIFGVRTLDIMQHALQRLPTVLRPVDRFVQLSDEKLCIVLPNLKTSALAMLAASKLQQSLDAPFKVVGGLTHVRPVVGIACFPDHADDAEELVIHADVAERIARGRDLAQHVFQHEDRGDADTYLGLDAPLREAIRTNQLEMHYQPQINLKTGVCHAVEGLLRWTLPDHGAISPPAIIRIAETNRQIGHLTTWVLGTVLRHQSEWKQLGVDLEVSLNLSTVTLAEADLPDVISQAMRTWGTSPEKVTLEITENTAMSDAEQSLAVMKRLKQMGLRLSVDDFGTGHSSLSYVKNFPLDELKIDKSFVQHMRQSKGDQQIVRSVIELAHSFGLSVVAEGVEDEATFKDLKKMGCDTAQGYVVSAALPSAELLGWLKKRR